MNTSSTSSTSSIFYLASSMMNHVLHDRLRQALNILQEIEDQLIMEISKLES